MSLVPVTGGWVYSLDERPKMELIPDVGTIYGARYFTVEINYGGEKWKEMEKWCIDSFGPVSNIWGTSAQTWTDTKRWYMNNSKFWFRNESDREWFILRWQ